MKKLLLITIMFLPIISAAQVITVPNGDFESPTNTTSSNANWAGSWFESNNDIILETTNKISGTYSCRLPGNSSAVGANNSRSITTANAAAFGVTVGNSYKVTCTWRFQRVVGPSGPQTAGTGDLKLIIFGTNTDGNTGNARGISRTALDSTSTTSTSDVTTTLIFKITDSTYPKIKMQFYKGGYGLAYIDDVTLEDLGVLPITLSSFTGVTKDYGVGLNWTTTSEVNNQHFEVLRSGDDRNFVSIGKINGAGNSSETKNYSFSDFNPLTGNNYYQLKQVDLDGKSESFGPVVVKFGLSEDSFTVLSTSETSVTINISSAEAKQAELAYVGLDGRTLYKQDVSLTGGLNTFNLPVDKSTGNIGIITLRSNGEQKSLKIAR